MTHSLRVADTRVRPYLLSVEPSQDATRRTRSISVMLWRLGSDEPRLVEVDTVASHADVVTCLATLTATYGMDQIAVNWNEALRADGALVLLVSTALRVQPGR